MNVVIDVGNTRTKYAFFKGRDLVEAEYGLEKIFERLETLKSEGEAVDLFLSGSGRLDDHQKARLNRLTDSWLEARPQMPLPITIGYDTPDSLGFDRIANCVGAVTLFPGRPLLVIDSGTAITFNYVDETGRFIGGNISPGLDMRFRGLHLFTARLPHVEPRKEYGGIGRSTETAIRNGVLDGMLFEAQGYVDRFVQSVGVRGQVVITGGNGHFFENKLDPNVRFVENLGFIGLNAILEYVKNEKIG